MLCLWCDDPTVDGDKLCPPCRAVNDGPVFHCADPRHTVPTLGTSCAACEWEREAKERRAAANAPIIEQLKAIRARLIADWHKPWPGCEHGKALVGMMIDGAIKELSE